MKVGVLDLTRDPGMIRANEAMYPRKITCFSDCDDAEPIPSKETKKRVGSVYGMMESGGSEAAVKNHSPYRNSTGSMTERRLPMSCSNYLHIYIYIVVPVLSRLFKKNSAENQHRQELGSQGLKEGTFCR